MIVTPESLKNEACQNEINAVLAKYNLKLDPFFHIGAAGMSLGINFIPATPVKVPVLGGKADG